MTLFIKGWQISVNFVWNNVCMKEWEAKLGPAVSWGKASWVTWLKTNKYWFDVGQHQTSHGTTSCISWARTWLDKQGTNSPVFLRFSMINSVLITVTLRTIDIHKFPWEWRCLTDCPAVGDPVVVWGLCSSCWRAFGGLGTSQGERWHVNLIFFQPVHYYEHLYFYDYNC